MEFKPATNEQYPAYNGIPAIYQCKQNGGYSSHNNICCVENDNKIKATTWCEYINNERWDTTEYYRLTQNWRILGTIYAEGEFPFTDHFTLLNEIQRKTAEVGGNTLIVKRWDLSSASKLGPAGSYNPDGTIRTTWTNVEMQYIWGTAILIGKDPVARQPCIPCNSDESRLRQEIPRAVERIINIASSDKQGGLKNAIDTISKLSPEFACYAMKETLKTYSSFYNQEDWFKPLMEAFMRRAVEHPPCVQF